MPNYDLGTAHGRIKIDLDDKASAAATRNLTEFQKTMESMDRKLGSMSANLSKIEKSLRDTGDGFDYAAGGVDDFDKSLGRANVSVLGSINNFRAQAQEIKHTAAEMKRMYDITDKYVAPVFRLVQAQRQLGDSASGFSRATTGIKALGLTHIGVGLLRDKFLGMHKAMENLPSWEKKILKVGSAVGALTVAGGFINKVTNGFLTFNNAGRLLEGGMGRLSNVVSRVTAHHEALGNAVRKVIWPVIGLGNSLKDNLTHMQNFSSGAAGLARSATQMVVGFAVMKNGLKGIQKDFAWLGIFAKGPVLALGNAFGIIPAAVQAAGQALMWVSNVISGLWAGIQQLSGGLLVLPGALSMLGVAGLTVMAIFKGIGKSFKDLLSSDPKKVAAAMEALPPELRKIGGEFVALQPKLKDFQSALRTEFFQGLDVQVRALADNALPRLKTGMLQTTGAIRGVADAFLKFFGQANTQSDFSLIFTKTADTIRSLTPALAPLLSAFRDISLVGAGFLRDMASTIPGVIDKFAQWAQVNRENGRMLGWMQDAWKGAKDLTRGMWDLLKATYGILTAFKTRDNGNFLAEFAKSMEKFNDAVHKSSVTGVLRQIGDAVRNLGTNYLQNFKDMWISVGKAAEQVGKLLYGSITGSFIPVLRSAIWVVEKFFGLLNSAGLGPVVSVILTLGTAFKVIQFVVMPIVHTIQALWGVFKLGEGAIGTLSAIKNMMVGLGVVSAETAGKIGLLGSMLSVTLGALAAAAVVVGALWLAWSQGNSQMDATRKSLEDQGKAVEVFRGKLDKAFMADNGFAGKTVMDAVSTGVDDMMYKLDQTAKSGPGIAAHIADWLKPGANNQRHGFLKLSDTDELNNLQKEVDLSGKARDRLQELIDKHVNLGAAISGSDSSFKSLIDQLRGSGEGSDVAIQKMEALRQAYLETKSDMDRVGPGAIAVANGIKKIAEAGGDATSKLEGLRQALTGAGLLKTDALEAAAAYSEKIAELGNNIADLSAKAGNYIDPLTGTFDTASEKGIALFHVMTPIGAAFLANVAAGHSVTEAYAQFEAQIDSLMKATGLTREQIVGLSRDVGILPNEVGILIQAVGGDQAKQDIIAVMTEMAAEGGRGVKVDVKFETKADANTMSTLINSILGPNASTATGTTIEISPTVNMNDWNTKVLPKLAAAGIQVSGGPPPTAPATLPVAPGDGSGGYKAGKATVAAPVAAAPVAPAVPPPPVVLPPPVQTPPPPLVVPAPDLTAVTKAFEAMQATLTQAFGACLVAVQQFAINAVTILEAGAGQAAGAGLHFGQDFADGITASRAFVIAAAAQIAADAKARLPANSPAKKGPLSGSGWTKYAGMHFSTDFATGIVSASGQVSSAAASVANLASMGLGYTGGRQRGKGQYDAGIPFLSQLDQFVQISERIFNVFKDIGDNALKVINMVSQSMDKAGGTLFGQRLGWQRGVSDKELQTKREDALQQKAMQAASGANDYVDVKTQKGAGVAGLTGKSPSKQEIADAILTEATNRGYTPAEAKLILQTAIGESDLSQKRSNGDHIGIFQQDASYPNRKDLQGNITGFFDRLDQTQGNIVDRITNTPAAGGVQGGGYGQAYLDKFSAKAQEYIDKQQQITTGTIMPGNQQATQQQSIVPELLRSGNIQNLAAGIADRVGHAPPSEAQMGELAKMFNLTELPNATHPPDKGYHGPGFAFDFSGSKEDMQRFADFVSRNFRDQTLQLIHDAPGGKSYSIANARDVSRYGYYADAGDHSTHVHWATDVAPVIDPAMISRQQQIDTNTGHKGPDMSTMTEEELQRLNATGGYSLKTQQDMLAELRQNNPALDQAITVGQDPNSTDSQVASSLSTIDDTLGQLSTNDTPAGRAQVQSLKSVQGEIASQRGMVQSANPLAALGGVTSSLTGVFGDVFKLMGSTLDAIGGAKNIADTLVRGVQNTQDIYKMVDEVQKFIKLAADISQTVTDGLALAAAITGSAAASDPSGGVAGAAAGLAAAAGISELVTMGIQMVNTVVDVAQSLYQIAGSYVGDWLGYLVGGTQHFQGDVKFLLDKTTGQLLNWSSDNPANKVTHDIPGAIKGPQYSQGIGQINVYGGPGSDPRDNTRQMMFQVKQASMNGALKQ